MKRPRAKAERCALCGRPLKRPGRRVPGVGVLGPECHRKLGAFEHFLEKHGALELIGAGLEVHRTTPPKRLEELQALFIRLERAGLRVRREDRGPDRAVFHLAGVASRTRLQKELERLGNPQRERRCA